MSIDRVAGIGAMCRLLVIALILLLPAVSRAQKIPCSTCGRFDNAIDANSATIREPSVVVFGHAGPSAQIVADWRTRTTWLGHQLVVLDSVPQSVYVATPAREIQSGWSDSSWPQRGFLLMSQEHGVSKAMSGEPDIARLFAMSMWQRTPRSPRVVLWIWPMILAVRLVTIVGAVWIPVLTALVSPGLARGGARMSARIVAPALLGFAGVAIYPFLVIMVACMQGECL